jgi:bifunctional DNase/RNase
MIEMKVLGLTLDNATKAPILVLRAGEGEDILPLWIGATEAMAISLALAGARAERPLTHDLMLDMMRAADIRLTGMSIVDLRNGVFYGMLDILCGERATHLDCRPTDGIVLALRAGSPIHAAPAVLARAPRERYLAAVAGQQLLQGEDGSIIFTEAVSPQPAPRENSVNATRTAPAGRHRHTGGSAGEDPYIRLLRNLEPASKIKM